MKLLLTSAIVAFLAIVASATPNHPTHGQTHRAFKESQAQTKELLKFGDWVHGVKKHLADHHDLHTSQGVQVPKELPVTHSSQSRGFHTEAVKSVNRKERAKKHVMSTSTACTTLAVTANLALYAGCFVADVPPIMSQQMTEADATAKIATFKWGLCYNATQLVMANQTCFASDVVILGSMIHSAWNDYETGSTTRVCAHTWANLNRQTGMFGTRDCANFTANECTAAGSVCRLRPTDYLGDVDDFAGSVQTVSTTSPCEENHDTASNAKLCTGCISTWINKWKGLNQSNELAQGLQIMDGILCKIKIPSGESCMPILQTSMDAVKGQPFATEGYATSFCTNNNSYSCFKRTYKMLLQTIRGSMGRTLKVCLKGHFPSGVPADLPYNHTCLAPYLQATQYFKLQENIMKLGCKANAAGKYCNQLREAVYRNSDKCYNTAQVDIYRIQWGLNVTCTDACKTSLGDALTNMGCCAGSIQEALSGALYKWNKRDFPRGIMKAGGGYYTPIIPPVTQLATSAPLTLASNEVETVASGQGFFANLAVSCKAITGVYDTLRVKCKPSGVKISKALKLRIAFSSLTTDQKTNLQAALKTDMANNLGLSEDEIVNDALVEDTTVQIETTTSSTKRRFVAQDGETTSAGTSYTFDIETEDEASGTAASNNYDSMESSGTFTMTETEDETGETVDSGEAATAEDTSEVDGSSSGASGIIILFSLTVSALLAVFA